MSEITLGVDVATLLIVLSGAIYGVYFWSKRRKQNEEYEKIMDDPIEFHFFVPHKELGIILKYYNQDGSDHEKDELVIPPNFEADIIILMRPKLNLLINDWYCGFGTPNSKIPELSFSDVYVVQSSNRNSPWYIDRYGCIHFEVKRQVFKNDVGLRSIRIKTYEKGNYPLEIASNVISNEYKEVKKEIGRRIIKHLQVKVE
jgi:hypothetical protein